MGGGKTPKPEGASEAETGIQGTITDWWNEQMAGTPQHGEGSTNALAALAKFGKSGAFKGAIPKALKYAQGQIMGEGTSFGEYYDPERQAINRRYQDEYGKTVNTAASRGIFGSSAVQDMGSRLAEGREASLSGARGRARGQFEEEQERRFGRGLSALGFASNLRGERRAGARDIYGIESGREQELYERKERTAGQGLALLGSHRKGRQQTWDEINKQYQNKQQQRSDLYGAVGGAAGTAAGLINW